MILSSPDGEEFASDAEFVAMALGVPLVRIEILRALASEEFATISQLTHLVGSTRNNVRKHLDVLERLGIVRQDVRRLPGSFRPPACYSLDVARLEEVAWLVFETIAPNPEPN